MAKDESRRWQGWRTGAPAGPLKGSKPTKPRGTKRRTKLYPWYWVKATKPATCGGCGEGLDVGQVIAVSRPEKVLCGRCVRGRELKVKTSRKLAEERRKAVIDGLRSAAGDA